MQQIKGGGNSALDGVLNVLDNSWKQQKICGYIESKVFKSLVSWIVMIRLPSKWCIRIAEMTARYKLTLDLRHFTNRRGINRTTLILSILKACSAWKG